MEFHQLSNSHIRQELGERARFVRKQRGLSQTQLADRADLTRPTVSGFERGKDVSLDTFLSILRALDMLDALGAVVPAPLVSPMEELTGGRPSNSVVAESWTWGDEAR